MVIVRVRRMMGDDDVRLALTDGAFDELHKFQMRNRVHLDVRECGLELSVYSKEVRRSVQIFIQLLILRAESARLRLRTHDGDINLMSLTTPSEHGRTSPLAPHHQDGRLQVNISL